MPLRPRNADTVIRDSSAADSVAGMHIIGVLACLAALAGRTMASPILRP